ncbi:hypothetical protein [Nonomuraea dietziae]|uniref:hypothetical protein n=1 Tax=Nonomuraea dietziae TaxID=65515 RepID=UPI0031D5E555
MTGPGRAEPGYYEAGPACAWAGGVRRATERSRTRSRTASRPALCLAGSERLGEVAEVEAELFRAHPHRRRRHLQPAGPHHGWHGHRGRGDALRRA